MCILKKIYMCRTYARQAQSFPQSADISTPLSGLLLEFFDGDVYQGAEVRRNGLYFDKQDRDMLIMINRVLSSPQSQLQNTLYNANLHPHGIKDLVISQVSRVAYAVVNLLTSLEAGQAADRLLALKALYDEVLNSAQTALRRNTARVLLQIMKELVRAHGDELTQLKLAHDFRAAARGTPRVVRRMLARYHLPEMPEDWSQLAFDDHVHDANTKGRKTPTHLIMDAWIKGVRTLTVVYYNFVEVPAAQEILEAAAIMGISVRIGLEFRTPFRGRFISFIWVPRGFSDAPDFLEFLTNSKMRHLMEKGREASGWQQGHVLRTLEYWNEHHRLRLQSEWGAPIAPMDKEDFLAFVGTGQPSLVHLAEYILKHILPAMQTRAAALRPLLADPARAEQVRQELEALDGFGYESVMDEWLSPKKNPGLPSRHVPDQEGMPELLSMQPGVLVSWLTNLHSGYRIILNLAKMDPRDVLELLWDCQGGITHLEIFNLKDWHEGRLADIGAINELQRVLNEGRGPRIKQLVRKMIREMESEGDIARRDKFQIILRNVPTLWEYYKATPLKSRMGSDSASRTSRNFGMGMVFPETLPVRAQKALKKQTALTMPIPVCTRVEERITYTANEHPRWRNGLTRVLRRLPGCRHLGYRRRREWVALSDTSRVCENGNVAGLGGLVLHHSNGLMGKEDMRSRQRKPGPAYLSTEVTNWLKVLAGFIPSVFSFWYTQDWWFLAWFGTVIWFGITGVRNIIQMVMAGGGVAHTTLLRWRDHVSLNRICDSLMYTGISVFLLEVIVRVWMLEDWLGYNVREDSAIVFTVLNIVNGFYICAHNVYRGFPREAAIGNIFRSALAIPVSSLYNAALLKLLLACGVVDPMGILVPSAAIVSKLASDTVAALIEGYADSQNNLRMRRWDYDSKLARVFECYTRLELLFPEEDVLRKLARPGGLGDRMDEEARRLELALLVNALDLMYFWFYQPRAQDALKLLVRGMPQADRTVLVRSQLVLVREREISQLLVDGLVGRNFSRPLAFYLARRRAYLRAMTILCTPGRRVENAAA